MIDCRLQDPLAGSVHKQQPSKNMSSRFVALNEDDIAKLLSEKDSKSTVHVTKSSVELFGEFLSEKKSRPNFEDLSVEHLNIHLKIFVASLRKKSRENLKPASVTQVHYRLNIFEAKMLAFC